MRRIGFAAFAFTILMVAVAVPAVATSNNFNAHLSGKSEVPARDTKANGEATFTLSKDETTLEYRINVTNIDNVTAVQIQKGSAGETGGVLATLFGPVAPGGGPQRGNLTKGAITASNLVGDLTGKPLSDLIALMSEGKVYVNVLTDDGQGAPDEKPGDFSSGEIRGQIR